VLLVVVIGDDNRSTVGRLTNPHVASSLAVDRTGRWGFASKYNLSRLDRCE